jgi:hypothetical protein
MADVQIAGSEETADGYRFDVTIDSAGVRTSHEVTMSHADYERWGDEGVSPSAVVRRCVELLLNRVAQRDLMPTFDVRQAVQLYPAFEIEAHRRIG